MFRSFVFLFVWVIGLCARTPRLCMTLALSQIVPVYNNECGGGFTREGVLHLKGWEITKLKPKGRLFCGWGTRTLLGCRKLAQNQREDYSVAVAPGPFWVVVS